MHGDGGFGRQQRTGGLTTQTHVGWLGTTVGGDAEFSFVE